MALDFGEAFTRAASSIELLLQLAESRKRHAEEMAMRKASLASEEARAAADRQQRVELANLEATSRRGQSLADRMAQAGVIVDEGQLAEASKIRPELSPLMTPGGVGEAVAGAAGQAEQRRGGFMERGAAALAEAGRGGPGTVKPFEGGFAVSPQKFPTSSVSTSYTGVAPDQLTMMERRLLASEANDAARNAVAEYRARNPWGDPNAPTPEEQMVDNQIASRAAKNYIENIYPLIQSAIPRGVSAGGGSQTIRATGRGTPEAFNAAEEAFNRQLEALKNRRP